MRRIFLTSILLLISGLEALPQVQPQKPQEEPPPVLTVPKEYRYNARGRRDPFVNPVPKPKTPTQVAPPIVKRPDGLKGVLVAEAQVAGVVTSKEPSMNVVIIAAPGAKTSRSRREVPLTAAALVPGLAWIAACKPTIGLAVAA